MEKYNIHNRIYDAIVIGGGCAGVNCAQKMYTSGLTNILLLEAQEVLGGRIKTTYLNNDINMPIEIGANWIHGIVNNPLYRLVKENSDLFFHDKEDLFTDDVIYCADLNGKRYSSQMCYQMYDIYRQLNNEAKLYWEDNVNCPYKNYEDFIVNRFEHYIRNDDPQTKNVKLAMIRRLLKQETLELSCTSMAQSTISHYGSYLKLEGPDFEFPGGFSKLIAFLASKLPKEAIKLNHPVQSITVSKEFGSDDKNGTVLNVMCSSGKVFLTRHVVVTCSLNYLVTHHQTLFPTRLISERKLAALNTMKMGTTNKHFLVYDDMSWFPSGFNSIHPLYFNDEKYDIVNDWQLKVFTFDKFYDNVLLVWLTGDEANHVENLPDLEVVTVLTNLLKKLLNNNQVPLPTKVIRTRWHSNPYVLGAYSYVGAGGNSDQAMNDIIEPVYIDGMPKILFAGEATHPRFYSTVHGAYLSGEREAHRLLELFNKKMS